LMALSWLRLPKPLALAQTRSFLGWFDTAFNKYDKARVNEVGPNRAAAEWLLRCGAGVKWHNSNRVLKDYNSLPVGNYRTLKIQEIEGTDSAVMEEGFLYLKELEELRKVKMVNNKYLNDECIFYLVAYTKKKLTSLHLAGNGNITGEGLLQLGKMEVLEELYLANLHEVKSPEEILRQLGTLLPDCSITWPPFSESKN